MIRPPEIVETLPARTRMPPELRLRITPLLSERLALPAMVREFGVTFAAAVVVPVVSWTLLFAAIVLTAEYSLAANGRRMAVVNVVPLPVAKEVPLPVSVASTKAHGRIPLVLVPLAPPCPLNRKPFVAPVSAIVATPLPAAWPRLVPRKSTEAPVGPVPLF